MKKSRLHKHSPHPGFKYESVDEFKKLNPSEESKSTRSVSKKEIDFEPLSNSEEDLESPKKYSAPLPKREKKKNIKNTISSKKKIEEPINVTVDMSLAEVDVSDKKRLSYTPFLRKSKGSPSLRLYSKSTKEKVWKEILEQYTNSYTSEETIRYYKNLIKENIDPAIYLGLQEYDLRFYTDKQNEYVHCMLQNIKKKHYETSKGYDKRCAEVRYHSLKKSGINIEYKTKGSLFSSSSLLDRFSALFYSLKSQKIGSTFSNKKQTNLKDKAKTKATTTTKASQNPIKNTIDLNSEQQKMPKKYTAKKGIVRAATIAAAALFATVSVNIGKVMGSNLNTIPNPSPKNMISFEESEKNMDANTVQINNELRKSSLTSELSNINIDLQELVMNLETSSQDYTETLSPASETVVLKDALMDILDIGVGSEFSMSEGVYRGQMGQQGTVGHYENYENETFKIDFIKAKSNDGQTNLYNLEDGKDISQIKAENPDALVSYHIAGESIKNMGWNDSTENDIETQLIKHELMSIKSYLSTEDMEFLCNNNLDSSIDKNTYQDVLEHIRNSVQEYKTQIAKENKQEQDIER